MMGSAHHDPDSPFLFKVSSETDPDGTALQRTLEAHAMYQEARHARMLVVNALALLGGFLWILAVRPQLFGPTLRPALVAGWAVLFLGLLAAILRERAWYRERARASEAQPPTPPDLH
jgi:hypothetical protein